MNHEELTTTLGPGPVDDDRSETGSNASSQELSAVSPPDYQAEVEKYRDLYLRTQADMENMKKRLAREKADFLKFANENLIKDVLPILDNLERALSHTSGGAPDQQGVVEGIRLTQDGLMRVLERFGVKGVNTTGQRFDPTFHEAVMQQENGDVESGMILQEVQKGYLLHDRLIRPALVIVAKRPSDLTEEE